MAQELDPFEKVLIDLGKMRGSAYNDLLRLPQGSLTKFALQNIDGLMSQLETDIRTIHNRLALRGEIRYPPPERFDLRKAARGFFGYGK